MSNKFEQLRIEYRQGKLDEKSLEQNPFQQFENWLGQAIASKIHHPDAMTLSTVTAEGTPDARIVLLKEITEDGFRFYSNYLSAKGRQLSLNYAATALFFWPELERQVRIKGTVEKLDEATSDAYFSSRPLGSRLSALASPQSETVSSRKWLEDQIAQVEDNLKGQEPKRPRHWGGYTLRPYEFEFWQGRENRLHDRLRYRAEATKNWKISRIAP